MVGIATSFRRETLWCLATYAVLPGRQGQGIGKPLLAAAMQHGRGCTRGMLSASSDPKAVRIYRQAGFDLHPQMYLDRHRRPADASRSSRRSARARAADIDLMDSLDRRDPRRRARRRPRADAARPGGCWSPTPPPGRATPTSTSAAGSALLAASNRRTATRLLWAALADGPGQVRSCRT